MTFARVFFIAGIVNENDRLGVSVFFSIYQKKDTIFSVFITNFALPQGSASNGGYSQNSAQASNIQSSGLFGQLSHSNTGAVSNQQGGGYQTQPVYYH